MADPKAVIIWLNYNSSKMSRVVLSSLQSIADLDYDDYHLIIVDNGSIDGSKEMIKSYIERSSVLRRRTRFLELSSNLGFTGAHNIAWRYILSRYPRVKYIVLLNNDAIAEGSSLSDLIEVLNTIPNACGVQGVIELRRSGLVDSFGAYIDELFNVYPFMWLKRLEEVPGKCFAVTYVPGAYSVYRFEALKRIALKAYDLFPSQAFAYFDDDLLGILAYVNGYSMISIPVKAASHFTSLTFRVTGTREYFGVRSYIAKSLTLSSRYRPCALLYGLRSILRRALPIKIRGSRTGSAEAPRILMRDIVDGYKLARALRRRYGVILKRGDVAKIPMLRMSLLESILSIATYRKAYKKLFDHIERFIVTEYGFKCV